MGTMCYQTLGYRAPEVCFGDQQYGPNVDCWSLGCSLAELLIGGRLFRVNSNLDNQKAIFGFAGTAECNCFWDLPLFPHEEAKDFQPKPPALDWNSRAPWLPAWTGSRAVHFRELMRGLFQIKPCVRMSARQALRELHDHSLRPQVPIDQGNDGRGPARVIQYSVDDGLLQWMQRDPAWAGSLRRLNSIAANTCACQDCSKPPASVHAFGSALRKTNRRWLLQLTSEVRAALSRIPWRLRGPDYSHFFVTCFSDIAFTYSFVQVMHAEERTEPAHFDGAAGVLLATLTIFGLRGLQFKINDAWLSSAVQQVPGSFCVATGASALHSVHHYADPGELYREREDDEGLKIVVVFRSDMFQATGPNLGMVFDVVNECVARKIAQEPLAVPTMDEVMHCFLPHALLHAAASEELSYRSPVLRFLFSPSCSETPLLLPPHPRPIPHPPHSCPHPPPPASPSWREQRNSGSPPFSFVPRAPPFPPPTRSPLLAYPLLLLFA